MAVSLQMVVLVLLLLSAALVDGRLRPCLTDADCKYDKCCVFDYTGQSKVCRGMPEHLGDPCGGLYFCPTCSYNMVCTPLSPANETTPVQQPDPTVNDTATSETVSCPPPANATCQMPVTPQPGVLGQEL